MIQNPVILDASGNDLRLVSVYDASVALTTDASASASVKLAEGEKIAGRTYVKMYTAQGLAGVFRSRSPRVGYGAGRTSSVDLEHAINELGDYIFAKNVEKNTTVKKALQEIFKYYKGSHWKLGAVDMADEDVALSVDYENCLEAINGIIEQHPSLMFTYDFNSFPWKLNVVKREETVSAEGRLSRNVKSAVVTTDDTDLCTRVFMDGLQEKGDDYGSIDDPDAINTYGVIETVISSSNTSKTAKSAAKSYLRRHKKPRYSIEIDGIELSNITGETLDKFTIGKLMRLAVPDFGISIEENIVQLTWSSVYKSPNSVTVTLSDREDKITKRINDQNKQTQKAVRAAAATAKGAADNAVTYAYVKDNVLYLLNGKGEEVAHFSKAVTLYKDSAHDAGWSGGKFTVNAYTTQVEKDNSGKAVEVETKIATATTTLNGIDLQEGKSPTKNGTRNLNVPLRVFYDNGKPAAQGNKSATGYETIITVSAKPVYDQGTSDGWDKARGYVQPPVAGTTNEMVFGVPALTYDDPSSYTFKVSVDNDYAYIKNAVNTTVARTANSAYGNGWRAANDALVMPAANTTSSMDVIVPSSNVNQTATYTYTVSVDNNFAYIKNAVNTTVARVANTGTSAGEIIGWDLARSYLVPAPENTTKDMVIGIPAVDYNNGSEYDFTLSVDNTYAYVKNALNKTVARVSNTAYANGWRAANDALVMPAANTSDSMDVVVPSSNVSQTATYSYTVSVDGTYAYIKNAVNTVVARVSNTGSTTNGKHDGWDLARGYLVPPSQNTTATMTIGIPASTYNQASSYDFTVSVSNEYAYIKNAVNTVVARVDNTAYTNGWKAANNALVMPGSNTSASMDVVVPSSNKGQTSTYTYTVSVSNDYAYIKNASNVTVARTANTAYTNGWKAANNALVMPKKNTSSASMDVVVPSSNLNQTATYTYTVSVSDDYAYIKNAANTTVARVENTAFANGHDSVTGSEIDLNGSSSSSSSSKPTAAVSKTPSQISGYIWLQKSNSKWYNLRSFSITTGADHYTVPIYYKTNDGMYHKIAANKLCYSDH